MKKALFSFAVAAVAFSMAACGNNSAQNAGSQDSTAAIAEEQSAESITTAMAQTIDKAAYSIGLPEGWAVMSESDTECMIYKGSVAKPSETLDNTWLSVKIGSLDGQSLESAIEEMVKEMGAKLLDDVTIAGTTYKQCSYTEDGVESRILVTGKDKNAISVMIARTTPDDPEILAILRSLKIK